MTTIISVVNEKGGSGKTTLSTNLGCALAELGHRVLLVDADPQGSLRDWSAANEQASGPPVIAIDRAAALVKEAKRTATGYDYVIIDGAPQAADLAAAAVRVADAVLVPIQPSPYDIWAAESTVEIVRQRQLLADGSPRTALLVSRQIQGTTLAAEIRDALVGYELPIMTTALCQRVAYAASAARGQSVLTWPDAAPAANEVRALAQEVLAWLS